MVSVADNALTYGLCIISRPKPLLTRPRSSYRIFTAKCDINVLLHT